LIFWKESAMGMITRVAGTGTLGNTGDDGPATDAQLFFPAGVAVTADGGFLIADTLNDEVRAVSAAGVITRVAGTGSPGNTGNSVVRAVSAAGMITRVAGTGIAGNSGDDGPATDAELRTPTGVAVTADGGFLIADTGSFEVREVAAG